MADKDPRVTIKIPRPLYEKVQVLIEGSSFSSPTDFIVYVLRDLVAVHRARAGTGTVPTPEAPAPLPPAATAPGAAEELTSDEIRAIRSRLRSLGYLD